MAGTLLFDDQGEMWDAKSPLLADALHASLSGEELLKYVVRNLGFIAVTENGGSLRLQLRPAIVSQTALGALLYWLHDQTVERAMISLLDRDWTHELVRTREAIVRRLLACVKVDLEDRQGDFLNRPRPLHALQRSSPLRALLDIWAESAGTYDKERLGPLLQEALNGRFVLFEASAGSGRVYVRDVGQGLGKSGGYWLSRTKGLRVEDQPDYAYGQWVVKAYRQVLETREPSLDDVDAVIAWPHQPRVSYRYKRLVVPFEAGDRSTLLLSATVIDTDINLRLGAGQEAAKVGE
jgi:hypothetical protein